MTAQTKHTIADAIATALGEEFTFVPHEHSAIIRRADGLELTVGEDFRKTTHWSISQNFHTEAWKDSAGQRMDPAGHGESLPSINAARSKTPAKLARDIERRLLPEAERFHTIALERVGSYNSHHDAQGALASELGIEPSSHPHRRDHAPTYTRTWDLEDSPCVYSRVEAKVCGPYGDETVARVDMELSSITPAQAKAVLAALGLSA